MPVTAKLSRKFYERLGDDVTTELVEWFNTVDREQRAEFRELFEANFARLSSRIDDQRAMFEARFGDLQASSEAGLAALEARLDARMDARLHALKSSLLMWMVTLWVASLGTMIGLLKL